MRTSTATVITGQALEDIQRVANGENKDQPGTWHKSPNNLLAIIQTPLPLVIRYMRTKDIEEWRLLKTFAGVLGEAVQSGVRAVSLSQRRHLSLLLLRQIGQYPAPRTVVASVSLNG